tara:strand:+ start:17 stop:160 length:144 start_codon:yes stop_codon:yes gene_type:complete
VARSKEAIMKLIMAIFILLILSSCSVQKQLDDTEHLWIGGNGETFYE